MPYELFKFNPALPKVLTQDDIKDITSTIGWLLEHNAEGSAHDLVQYVFSNLDEKLFLPVLQGREDIAEEVRRLLSLDKMVSVDANISPGP